jgi:hypothetical protein
LLAILSTPNRHLGVECAFKTSCRQDKDSHYKEIEGWLRSALSSSSMTSKMLSMGDSPAKGAERCAPAADPPIRLLRARVEGRPCSVWAREPPAPWISEVRPWQSAHTTWLCFASSSF